MLPKISAQFLYPTLNSRPATKNFYDVKSGFSVLLMCLLYSSNRSIASSFFRAHGALVSKTTFLQFFGNPSVAVPKRYVQQPDDNQYGECASP